MNTNTLFYGAGIVLIVTLFGLSFFADALFPKREVTEETPTSVEPPFNPFEGVAITAWGALVYDTSENKILFAKNEQAQLPLASLAKIMTAIVALEAPDEKIVLTETALAQEGDNGLLAGEIWDPRDLLALTLVASSNDGAAAVRDAYTSNAFVEKMNATARELGLTQTYFTSATGLDTDDLVGTAYGSALDVARLFSYALARFPDVIQKTRYDTILISSGNYGQRKIENTNEKASELPGLLASKTGFTEQAGGNIALIFQPQPTQTVIVVVLGAQRKLREEEAAKLVWATIDYVSVYHGY